MSYLQFILWTGPTRVHVIYINIYMAREASWLIVIL
jgi:hypothetical protein